MNYRELLKKYIAHVGIEEGTTFLNRRGMWEDSIEFTDEEWAELQKLDKESMDLCSCPGAPYHRDDCPLSKNYKE